MKPSPAARPRFAVVCTVFEAVWKVIREVFRSLGWRAIPILLILLIVAMILVFGSAAPAVAPFVYTLF